MDFVQVGVRSIPDIGYCYRQVGRVPPQLEGPKGLVMVPRRRNPMTTQTLLRSRDPVLVLRQVLVSGPITALAAA